LLKGYKDNNDKVVATIRTDVNHARAKIPALRRELQDSTVGLAMSIKEIKAITQDIRAQVGTLPQVDQGTDPSTPPPYGVFLSTLPQHPLQPISSCLVV
jgi:hypothetical protein